MNRFRLLAGAAALALGVPALAGPAHADDPVPSPFKVVSPATVQAEAYDGVAYLDQGATLLTGSDPFELRATRASYDDPVVVRWMKPSGAVTLPADTMPEGFGGLHAFFKLVVADRTTGKVLGTRYVPLCPGGGTSRGRPDAPAHDPYPQACPFHPYTLGSVTGLQAGWYTTFSGADLSFRLKPGRYTLTTSIQPKYRALFGVHPGDATGTSTLQVVDGDEGDVPAHARAHLRAHVRAHAGAHARSTRSARSARHAGGAPLRPAAHRPEGVTGAPAGPRPDLRALPALGLRISPGGNYLQFSATVWNAGDSPLVVDGFRRDGQQVMDAYQYFFDQDGNQVGYEPVGTMEWDPRPSHHHWHFEDFARYTLLAADRTRVRRSAKEAFCLANTDAVDYTVLGADWNPDGTDLSTACGDEDSLSVREALASGSGDTYDQTRAGQSFSLKGLPNGVYYVEVEANPGGNLVEQSTSNDVSLRKVRIGGTTGHRTVKAWKVGLVDESAWEGDF